MTTALEAPVFGVYRAIAAVQGELAKIGISKDRDNTAQHYKFRGIDDIYDAVAPLLSKHKLCILPRVVDRQMTERISKQGSAMFYVIVHVDFDFVSAEDGSRHTVTTYGEAMDSADKATNKAMSAAYKYACLQTFCIPTEGDNDADATTTEVEPKRTTETPRATPQPKPKTETHTGNGEAPDWIDQPLGFGKKFPNATWREMGEQYAKDPKSGHGNYLEWLSKPDKEGKLGPYHEKAQAVIKWAAAKPPSSNAIENRPSELQYKQFDARCAALKLNPGDVRGIITRIVGKADVVDLDGLEITEVIKELERLQNTGAEEEDIPF